MWNSTSLHLFTAPIDFEESILLPASYVFWLTHTTSVKNGFSFFFIPLLPSIDLAHENCFLAFVVFCFLQLAKFLWLVPSNCCLQGMSKTCFCIFHRVSRNQVDYLYYDFENHQNCGIQFSILQNCHVKPLFKE